MIVRIITESARAKIKSLILQFTNQEQFQVFFIRCFSFHIIYLVLLDFLLIRQLRYQDAFLLLTSTTECFNKDILLLVST